MNPKKPWAASPQSTILVVESDAMVRTSLAQYLRHGGYRVIEAVSEDEALLVLTETDTGIGTLFCAVPAFALVQWIRRHRPAMQVVLAGSMQKAVHAAGCLCEGGPRFRKPYEPQQVIEWIRRLQASVGQKSVHHGAPRSARGRAKSKRA